ncbi:hypothetical protein ABH926_008722 [Catenulispora sp. GP43]|uniref:hypothetical protein n=1 Tax=Catenulispora sp. GP43 TaxID=3156263 RepID=UPI003517C9E8
MDTLLTALYGALTDRIIPSRKGSPGFARRPAGGHRRRTGLPGRQVTGFILVNPKMFGEVAATTMLLELPANTPPPDTPIVSDKGLRSRAFERELGGRDLVLIRPTHPDETAPAIRHNWAAGADQKRSLIADGH